MEFLSQPIVVELTPPSRGAVATLRVEGPGALAALEPHLRLRSHRRLSDLPADRPAYGHIGPEPGEEVVVRRVSAEAAEIHCHGGPGVVAWVRALLADAGCRVVNWPEWIALTAGDPIAAAAQCALAAATTQRAAVILLDQYQGALRREIDAATAELAGGQADRAAARLGAILPWRRLGLRLTQPWQVVLCGRPNAGKSSLINALLGFARSIVHEEPGTTRDVVTAETALEGWPVEFRDTAGLRDAAGEVERIGVERAWQQVDAADLAVLVVDRSRAWTRWEDAVAARRPDVLVVGNKSDLAPQDADWPLAGLAASAKTGEGLDRLAATIVGRLVPQIPPPGTAVPFTAEQVAAIDSACEALRSGRREEARRALGAGCFLRL